MNKFDNNINDQNGNNEDFNEINGGRGIDYTVELDWKDQFVVAVGTAVAVNEWLVLRAGYNYANNPISEDFILGNSIGTEEHLTAGAGVVLGPWDLDIAYMYKAVDAASIPALLSGAVV